MYHLPYMATACLTTFLIWRVVLVSGDRDFVPALVRTRQKVQRTLDHAPHSRHSEAYRGYSSAMTAQGKRVAITSMRNSAAAEFDAPVTDPLRHFRARAATNSITRDLDAICRDLPAISRGNHVVIVAGLRRAVARRPSR